MAGRSTEPVNTVRPRYIYSLDAHHLHRADLLTGEMSCYRMPDYLFKIGNQWSELPGGSLLITGGDPYEDNLEPHEVTTIAREVAKIDTLKEFAVFSVPPMHSARSTMQLCITLSTSTYWEGTLQTP
jgi:hypothetical protein